MSLNIFEDNPGRIAAAGREIGPNDTLTDAPHVLLLNANGRTLAHATVPLPAFTHVSADKVGRIFLMWQEHRSAEFTCAAFAPRLADLLWTERVTLSNAFPGYSISIVSDVGDVTANGTGGAYALGSLSVGGWNSGFFFSGSVQTPRLWCGCMTTISGMRCAWCEHLAAMFTVLELPPGAGDIRGRLV